ncbi:MAG: hypothetical protein K1X92_05880 [Bacteroidia bacterium]|nr:hypothetical protein [Bacteroidia bacterium]
MKVSYHIPLLLLFSGFILLGSYPSRYLLPNPSGADRDTIITTPNGMKLHVLAGTFAPYANHEVYIEVREFFETCELFGIDMHMLSLEGNYLVSDGMIFLAARKEGKTVEPKKSIEVWMPSQKIDTTMRVYTPQKTAENRTVWKKEPLPVDYHINRNRYYSFNIAHSGWYSMQKPVATDVAEMFIVNPKNKKEKKTKFLVKNKSYPHPMLRVIYADMNTYFELPEGKDGNFCLARYNTPENTILVSKVNTPENKTWYFAKRLSELEKKGGVYLINTEDYIVRKKNTGRQAPAGNAPTTDELLNSLCQRIFK